MTTEKKSLHKWQLKKKHLTTKKKTIGVGLISHISRGQNSKKLLMEMLGEVTSPTTGPTK
jgi:hypothetical protein